MWVLRQEERYENGMEWNINNETVETYNQIFPPFLFLLSRNLMKTEKGLV